MNYNNTDLRHECPSCNGTGLHNDYPDKRCGWCVGKERLTIAQLWNYYDRENDEIKAQILAWAKSCKPL